jgi:hypothetical protein
VIKQMGINLSGAIGFGQLSGTNFDNNFSARRPTPSRSPVRPWAASRPTSATRTSSARRSRARLA